MKHNRMQALLLYRASAEFDSELRRRFQLFEAYRRDKQEIASWIEANGDRVRAVITNGKVGCDGELIRSLPNLGIIAIHGVGFDNVDVAAAKRAGVAISYTPGVLTDDVADLAIGLTISLLRGIAQADRFVRDGCWKTEEFPLQNSVTGKRFGIVGMGRIGQAIAARLNAIGPVAYTAPSLKRVSWPFHADALSLAGWSDVLIVACAANERSRSLIDREVLAALGESGFLINIARGSIVDEQALAEAVASKRIAGAALDVVADEPQPDPRLVASDRTLLTPHIGSATFETRARMQDAVLASLDAFIDDRNIPNALHDPREEPRSGVQTTK